MEKLSEDIYFLVTNIGAPGPMSSYIHVHLNLLRFLYLFLGLNLPKVIYSFYMYFITDLDNDAFELSFPLWQVLLFESNSIVIAISIRLKGFPLTGKTYLDISWSYLYNLH